MQELRLAFADFPVNLLTEHPAVVTERVGVVVDNFSGMAWGRNVCERTAAILDAHSETGIWSLTRLF